jgi:hypothetical protein
VKRTSAAVGGAAVKLLVSWARDSPIKFAVSLLPVIGFSILTLSYWGWLGAVWLALCVAFFFARVVMIVLKEAPNPLPTTGSVGRAPASASRPHQKRVQPIQKVDQADVPRFWQLFIHNFVPVLSFIGILLYGVLAFSYERFYEALGLDPQDVGLTYMTTLMRSSGFIIEILFATGLFLFLPTWVTRKESRTTNSANIRQGYRALANLFFLYVLLVILMPLPIWANRSANALKSGKPVRPIQYIVPVTMTVLYIRADPVTVRSAVRPNESPAIDGLQTCTTAAQPCRLFYLGRNDQMAVIYDATSQRSIHVPLTMVLLERDNCATRRSQNPLCRDTGPQPAFPPVERI